MNRDINRHVLTAAVLAAFVFTGSPAMAGSAPDGTPGQDRSDQAHKKQAHGIKAQGRHDRGRHRGGRGLAPAVAFGAGPGPGPGRVRTAVARFLGDGAALPAAPATRPDLNENTQGRGFPGLFHFCNTFRLQVKQYFIYAYES